MVLCCTWLFYCTHYSWIAETQISLNYGREQKQRMKRRCRKEVKMKKKNKELKIKGWKSGEDDREEIKESETAECVTCGAHPRVYVTTGGQVRFSVGPKCKKVSASNVTMFDGTRGAKRKNQILPTDSLLIPLILHKDLRSIKMKGARRNEKCAKLAKHFRWKDLHS